MKVTGYKHVPRGVLESWTSWAFIHRGEAPLAGNLRLT